jgi:hypothetical protein
MFGVIKNALLAEADVASRHQDYFPIEWWNVVRREGHGFAGGYHRRSCS